MPEDTKYVAGRVVRFGGYAQDEDGTVAQAEDGSQVHEFQPGEEVPGAGGMENLDGLLLNGYLVPADEYVDLEAAAETEDGGDS